MKKQINEIKRMQLLAGVITESEYRKSLNENEDFNLNAAFKASPTSHSYNDVLNIIEDYEDEDILNDFKAEFPKGKNISKEKYMDFTMDRIDDMSEVGYIKANWISLSDPDIYDKAGLNESSLNENEDFNLNAAFKASPMSHSYNDVLDVIKDYEDENILKAFEAKFSKDGDISREDYSNFAKKYIDDMSEIGNIQANWISISDPDIYEKAGLNESQLNEANKIPQDLKDDLIASAEKDFPRGRFRSGHYVRQYLDPRNDNFKKLQKGIIKFGGKKGEITFKAPENSYFKNAEMTFEVNRDGRISYTVFAP